jgi:ElaB/YqjD/DUF883 family membrane-anchored ribosome-binding protein
MGESAAELRRDIENTRADLGMTLDAIGDRVSPSRIVERRRNRMVYKVRDFKDRIMGSAEHVVDRGRSAGQSVTGAGGNALSAGGDALSSMGESIHDTPDMVRQKTAGSPLVAGAIAFGFGFLVASVLPASDAEIQAEQRLVEKAEPIKQELTEAGKEMAEHLKEPAREAVADLKDTAREGAQGVTETARGAAQETAQHGKEAAQTVQDEARSS